MRYYLDCEFDGVGGPLISVALARQDVRSAYWVMRDRADDPWVQANVIPLLWEAPFGAKLWTLEAAAFDVAAFLSGDPEPIIIADWLVDIRYLCDLLLTGSLYWDQAGGPMFELPSLTLRAERVDAYPTTLPGAIQHNAWWDAMALRHLLEPIGPGYRGEHP